jgi:hypothetical protein
VADRRYRWNRKRYMHARQLARLLGRFGVLPYGDAPVIVQRYWELWKRYPSHGDPLLTPLQWRRQDPDIPF